MTEISYRPAPLAARQSIDPGADQLILRDAGGAEKWRMDWDRIEKAHYVEHGIKDVYMRRLDLIGGDPVARRSIACTSPSGLPGPESEAARYLTLTAAILDRLAADRPGFTVNLGEHGWSRRVMLGIGVLTVLSALAIAGLAVSTGVSGDRLAGGSVPMLLMLGIGVSLVYAYGPWRPGGKSPALRLAGGMRAMVEAGKD